ncbi:MAG: OmpA family protein [Nitrospirota bacterium]|nr:OmpA family protein [Nitrospirota bacterium]MDE3242444.1 OmpA family protein [Nitrospirota bacterium]
MILGTGDLCYLQLTKTSKIEVGGHVTIYRRINEIFHPAKGKYLGDLFMNVGVGLVTEVTQGLATVRLVRSWSPIIAGDRAVRFVPPPPEEPPVPGRSLPNVPGYIIAFPPSLSLIAQSHIVYIDWGRNDGLRTGDRLDVLRTSTGIPVQKIGELKVLAVEDTAATALVIRSTVPFLRADRIVFQEPPSSPVVRRSSAESIVEEMERLAKAGQPEQEATQQAAGAVGASEIDLSRLAALSKQLEFEPGASPINPTGQAALKEIGEILKTVSGQQILVEGHTDRIPIGPSLKRQYPNNVELSRARATGVVRYLVEEGGVDPANLKVVGHGDSKPIASNSTEEGRKQNRRIEIVLVPKKVPPIFTNQPVIRPDADSPVAASPEPTPPAAAEPPRPEEAVPQSPPVGEPPPPTQQPPAEPAPPPSPALQTP